MNGACDTRLEDDVHVFTDMERRKVQAAGRAAASLFHLRFSSDFEIGQMTTINSDDLDAYSRTRGKGIYRCRCCCTTESPIDTTKNASVEQPLHTAFLFDMPAVILQLYAQSPQTRS